MFPNWKVNEKFLLAKFDMKSEKFRWNHQHAGRFWPETIFVIGIQLVMDLSEETLG